MYSTYNAGKSVVAERFIKTLKNKIFKHMTAIQQNIYFDVLDDIVDKYNNTVHKTIKIKPIEVTNDFYAEYNENPSNKKNPKLAQEVFIINKIKNTVPWTYAISDVNDEEITVSFYEKELQKTNQKRI